MKEEIKTRKRKKKSRGKKHKRQKLLILNTTWILKANLRKIDFDFNQNLRVTKRCLGLILFLFHYLKYSLILPKNKYILLGLG